MKFYEASTHIQAQPETVWAILTDADGYPGWNPGIERVEGRIALGEQLKVFTKLSPGRAFPAKVTRFKPPSEMIWSGGMPLGLFKGVRTFHIKPEDGGTRFATREEFSGPMLPLIWRSMPDLGPSFEEFASSLRQRAEERDRAANVG